MAELRVRLPVMVSRDGTTLGTVLPHVGTADLAGRPFTDTMRLIADLTVRRRRYSPGSCLRAAERILIGRFAAGG